MRIEAHMRDAHTVFADLDDFGNFGHATAPDPAPKIRALHDFMISSGKGLEHRRTERIFQLRNDSSKLNGTQWKRVLPLWPMALPLTFDGIGINYEGSSCVVRRLPLESPLMKQTTSPLPADIVALSFEDALAELEKLIKQLEDGKAKLDDALKAYERGAMLKRHCETKLREAQAKIEQITVSPDGVVSTKPFDA